MAFSKEEIEQMDSERAQLKRPVHATQDPVEQDPEEYAGLEIRGGTEEERAALKAYEESTRRAVAQLDSSLLRAGKTGRKARRAKAAILRKAGAAMVKADLGIRAKKAKAQ